MMIFADRDRAVARMSARGPQAAESLSAAAAAEIPRSPNEAAAAAEYRGSGAVAPETQFF